MHSEIQPVATDIIARSMVCVSVSVLAIVVLCKTAELIEMPYGDVVDSCGSRNQVL